MPAAAVLAGRRDPGGHGPRVTGPGRRPPPMAKSGQGASRRPRRRQGRSRAHRPFAGPRGARARRGRRRVRQPRPVGGAGSRDRARPGGPGAGDRAGLRRVAPAGAHRSRAVPAGDQRPRQTRPARADRAAAWRAYQILFLDRVPAYAAVDDAVDACKQIARARRGGVRERAACAGWGARASRRCPTPPPIRPGYLVAAAGLPAWLAELLLAELPAAEALAFAASIADARARHAAREHRPRHARRAGGAAGGGAAGRRC